MAKKSNILRIVPAKRAVVVNMGDNNRKPDPAKSNNSGLGKLSNGLASYKRVDADAEWSLFMSKVSKE